MATTLPGPPWMNSSPCSLLILRTAFPQWDKEQLELLPTWLKHMVSVQFVTRNVVFLIAYCKPYFQDTMFQSWYNQNVWLNFYLRQPHISSSLYHIWSNNRTTYAGSEVEERVFATIRERLPLVATQPATQEKYIYTSVALHSSHFSSCTGTLDIWVESLVDQQTWKNDATLISHCLSSCMLFSWSSFWV